MAVEPGFPWQATPSNPEKEGVVHPEIASNALKVVEKKPEGPSGSPVKVTIANQTHPRKHSNSLQSLQGSLHFKHHRASLKAAAQPSYLSTTSVASVTEPVNHKPTSPLPVRTIPAWVRDAEEDDLNDPQFQAPDAPNAALVAQHHYSPSTARRQFPGRNSEEDSLFRPSSSRGKPLRTSRWMSFAQPSAYPRENFNSEKVDADWLNQHLTDYSKPWLADHNGDDDDENSSRYRAFRRKRQAWYKRAQFYVLRNPFIPLVFRLFVLIFAIAALALGSSIYNTSSGVEKCIRQPTATRTAECRQRVGEHAENYYQDPSGLMAVIVDAIAIAYTLYITYDEYFSKPLGLRRARAKVRLVLLDLFFVVFQSANLALSFESLTVDEGACKTNDDPGTSPKFDDLCDSAESLSAVLLISLTAWLMTFSVSVLRLVERMDG